MSKFKLKALNLRKIINRVHSNCHRVKLKIFLKINKPNLLGKKVRLFALYQ